MKPELKKALRDSVETSRQLAASLREYASVLTSPAAQETMRTLAANKEKEAQDIEDFLKKEK